MARLLTNYEFVRDFGERFRALCARHSTDFIPLTLSDDPRQRLAPDDLTAIEIGCFTGNFEDDPVFTRRFLGSALNAPNLKWMHLPNAGIDHPVFGRLLDSGVRLTTSSGVAAEPIAQTAIGALLALARGFPGWWQAQQRHEWAPHDVGQFPRDLRGQTMVIVGLGAIGNEIGRLARALGLHVIGIRRRARSSGDHVDAMQPPAALAAVLPQANWLVVACPLTAETRGLIDAAVLAQLPAGAHVMNIARGQIIDESALIESFRAVTWEGRTSTSSPTNHYQPSRRFGICPMCSSHPTTPARPAVMPRASASCFCRTSSTGYAASRSRTR